MALKVESMITSAEYGFTELHDNVIAWAKERKIIPNATQRVQLVKALEELGETAKAFVKDKPGEYKDGIGDTAVTIIIANALQAVPAAIPERFVSDSTSPFDNFGFIAAHIGYALALDEPQPLTDKTLHNIFNALEGLANLSGFTITDALYEAWNVIKDRKGTLSSSGVFIKEGD